MTMINFFDSSLSSVAPPDIWYHLALPKEVIENHLLSALQLEAIVYACQRQETMLGDGSRAGFLIGMFVLFFWLNVQLNPSLMRVNKGTGSPIITM